MTDVGVERWARAWRREHQGADPFMAMAGSLMERAEERLAAAEAARRCFLDTEIGGEYGVSAKTFLAGLPDGDITLHINSPGGSAPDALTIYSALRQRPGTVSVMVDCLAASAASVVMCAASPGRLTVSRSAMVMVHEVWVDGMSGRAGDLRQQAAVLDVFNQVTAGVYAHRSGLPAEHWLPLMAAETWWTGQQIVDAGLADQVAGAQEREMVMASYRRELGVKGTDAYGHPVSGAAKRAAYARFEAVRDARRRAAGEPVVAAGRRPRSQFARETFALLD